MTTPLSLAARQARLLALRDLMDTGGTAAMWFYTGTQPSTPETTTTESLLCALDLATPCGAVGANGQVAALTITVPRTALAQATGVIGWVRFVGGSGPAVLDCAVTAAGGVGPVVVADTQIYTGGELQLMSCVLTE